MSVSTFADRVKDSYTGAPGTGNVTLTNSAPTGFRTFDSQFGHFGTHFYYVIDHGSEWEVGEGHLSAAATLVRDTVLSSSNAGSLVNFTSGGNEVYADLPASAISSFGLSGLTANQLPKATGASSIGNSRISDDGANNIFIDSQAGQVLVGDVNGGGNGTCITVDDVGETINLSAVSVSFPFAILSSYGFGSLPAGGLGKFACVTDATVNTWGANVTSGGGSNKVLVFHNGTNWTVFAK